MTIESQANPKWKRVFWFLLKIYAGLCTLLVTAYLGLVLWSHFFPTSSTESSEMSLKLTYAQYTAKESPKRAEYFCGLAGALASYTKDAAVPAADVLRYLGKPDLIDGQLENGTLVYFYGYSGVTNRYAAYTVIKDGRLREIGFSDAAANDLSGFEAYPRQ